MSSFKKAIKQNQADRKILTESETEIDRRANEKAYCFFLYLLNASAYTLKKVVGTNETDIETFLRAMVCMFNDTPDLLEMSQYVENELGITIDFKKYT